MSIDLTIEPSSEAQVYFLNSTKRNILFNSGYGGGKTYIACYKLLLLLLKFPNSRAVIGRQFYSDLMKTTAQTFYQICTPELYKSEFGGSRADGRGYLKLINGSEVFFMHFDNVDMNSIKSLEINFLLLDQAEEIIESIYLGLDARLGRKGDAVVPTDLLESNPDWPRNAHTNKPLVPVYSFILINPPDEGELNYLIQRFHPDSDEWKLKWQKSNDYVWCSSRDNKALPKENLENMLTRDPEWIARYVDGKIGQGEGAIHKTSEKSLIEVDEVTEKFIENLLKKAVLCRVLDHGASAPTCCLWFATYKGFHYCYREYYQEDKVISFHRKAIKDLSEAEYYSQNIADPSIFKKTMEKFGGRWNVANEYLDSDLDGDGISWMPGDNNEFATRNRINELLRVDPELVNPITNSLGSPRLFFFRKNPEFNSKFGCFHAIRQLKAQKKTLLDTINGKNIYSDDRDERVTDHAYDCIRYFCASHLKSYPEPIRKPSERSFMGLVRRIKALKQEDYYEQYQ